MYLISSGATSSIKKMVSCLKDIFGKQVDLTKELTELGTDYTTMMAKYFNRFIKGVSSHDNKTQNKNIVSSVNIITNNT